MIIIGIAVIVNHYYNSLNYFTRDNKKKQRGNFITLVVAIACVVAGSFLMGAIDWVKEDVQIESYPSDSTLVVTAKQEVAFEDSVYQYILFLNIKHPEVVFKQAKIESGNFKSKVFREYNNMFGMKMPYKRPTMAIGKTSSGFAIYDSWKDSVIDYALYQAYSAKNLSEEAYIDHLNDHYAEDSLYNSKIINYGRTTR